MTGSRAEYGLLRWVMEGIRAAPDLQLQLVATGMHLSPEFGLTWREMERDGFVIDRKVETLLSSDTAVGIATSMGLGLIGFGEALQQLQPDLLLVLGDRFEIFAAAAAALVARIPIAHVHGGETTASHANHQSVEIGHFFQKFERRRALPGHNHGMIVGRH